MADRETLTKPILTTKDSREFSVSVHLSGKRIIVRKSEIIEGIKVPLYETHAINNEDAVKIQHYLVQEIHKFRLN